MAKVQVDESLLVNAYKLISALEYYELDDTTMALKKALESQIVSKIEAKKKRELYTKYKTAGTDAEKEQARKEYVELTGMHPDFTY